jgi:hypothetical protein
VSVTSRADLAHALTGGLAVNEFAPSGKAAAELGALYSIVEKTLWPKQRARR